MWKLTGVDPESIDRELLRARRADQIDAKRAKRDAKTLAPGGIVTGAAVSFIGEKGPEEIRPVTA